MRDADDVVYWLQERALRRYGATMNAAHTKTQEWLWADEITRLREEIARLREELQKDFNAMRVFRRYRELEAEIETLRGLLREAHVKMDANNLWSNLRNRVATAIREGGDKDD